MVSALDAWVSDGTPPPASAVPTLAGDTLVSASALSFPPVGPPPPAHGNPIEACVDWVHPPREAESDGACTPLVPAVDADGNEIAGIRLPDVAVPLGTYTGWNVFRSSPAVAETCNPYGAYTSVCAAEGIAASDPRPAIAERSQRLRERVSRMRADAGATNVTCWKEDVLALHRSGRRRWCCDRRRAHVHAASRQGQ